MSVLEKKKEEVKKTIRSLVVSAPSGLTTAKLLEDYKSVAGEPLPLCQLGYTNLLTYLQDIPDAVRISYNGYSVIFYGVADEKTQHIQDMISKQRKSKPYSSLKKAEPVTSNRPRRPPVSHPRMRSYPPANIRQNISKVLKTLCNGIAMDLFENIYQQITGQIINLEYMGFKSLVDLFLSMPDIARMEYGRTNRNGSNIYVFPNVCNNNNAQYVGETKLSDNSTQKKSTNPKEPLHIIPEAETSSSSDNLFNSGSSGSSTDSNSSVINKKSARDSHYTPSLLKQTKKEVLDLLQDSPAGVWAIRLWSLYRKKYGKNLDLKSVGYFGVVEFVSTMSEQVEITRHDTLGDWMLTMRSDKDSKDDSDNGPDDNSLKKELLQLLKHSSLSIEELCQQYEAKYRKHLSMKRGPLYELLLAIPEIVMKHENGKLVVAMNSQVGTVPLNPSSIPPDACGLSIFYNPQQLPYEKVGDYIDVFLSEINTPGNFCVQLIGTHNTVALDLLMNNLEAFYCNDRADDYRVPPSMVKVGLVCAAIFLEDNNWHRAAILRVIDEETVDVLYVDYGSLATINVALIRLLHMKFIRLPSQKISARLADLKPANGKNWTIASKQFLLSLCREKPLVAYVKNIKDYVMSLYICDTSREDVDISYNQLMVEHEHAVISPEAVEPNEDPAQPQANQHGQSPVGPLHVKTDLKSRESPVTEILSSDVNFVKPVVKFTRPAETIIPNRTHEFDQPDENFAVMGDEFSSSSHEESYLIQQETCTQEENKEEPGFASSQGNLVPLATVDMSPLESKSLPMIAQKATVKEGIIFHIINHNENGFITVNDIMSLINKPDVSIVYCIMMLRKMKYEEFLLSQEGNETLFEQLVGFKVPDVTGGNKDSDLVCLYKISDLASILRKATCDHFVISQIQDIVQTFDPNEGYWWEPTEQKVDTNDTSSINFESLSLDELHKIKEQYCEQRHTTLQELVAQKDGAIGIDILTKLRNIEIAIKSLLPLIDNKEQEQTLHEKSKYTDKFWMIDKVLFDQKSQENNDSPPPDPADLEMPSLSADAPVFNPQSQRAPTPASSVPFDVAGSCSSLTSLHGRCKVSVDHKADSATDPVIQCHDSSREHNENHNENELVTIPYAQAEPGLLINWDEVRPKLVENSSSYTIDENQSTLDINSTPFVPKKFPATVFDKPITKKLVADKSVQQPSPHSVQIQNTVFTYQNSYSAPPATAPFLNLQSPPIVQMAAAPVDPIPGFAAPALYHVPQYTLFPRF